MPLPTLYGIETNSDNFAAGFNSEPAYWGLNAGHKNRATWEKLAIGNFILFKVEGEYRASARVAGKFEDVSLARRLWGERSYGGIWSLIIVLHRPTNLSVPAELMQVLGKHPGMRRVPSERVDSVIARIGLIEFTQVFGISGS